MKTLIHGGIIVNEGGKSKADVVIDNDIIESITETEEHPCGIYDEVIDAAGDFVMPGVIDSHVHLREPGLTSKADMESESRAAAWGGVTSFFDMPNTAPQTVTAERLREKKELAKQKSHINYAFFLGATNDNIKEIEQADIHEVPGIKVFMGASTGNMLVDDKAALQQIFSKTPLPVVVHCENSKLIKSNTERLQSLYGEDPDVIHHPEIRDEAVCYSSTSFAVRLAEAFGTRLHVAHISTAKELELFGSNPRITAEAVIGHLLFCDKDYARLGTRIKCNPSIKTFDDREALRRALSTSKITTIATDHAPHLLSDKRGGCVRAASGMPFVQFSLVTMLELADSGILTIERLTELMCHNPARLFSVRQRGFLRPGYKADIVLVRKNRPWTVSEDIIQSKCKWSPMLGHEYNWRVKRTICNGKTIYANGNFDYSSRGEPIMFR